MGIAVIGMSCRYPGACNIEEFWRCLRDGVEGISFFSENDLLASGVDRDDLADSGYVRAGGVVDDIEFFDAAFFRLTPRAAEILDPQQRLFLECCWEALESAGYDPDRYDGSVGVFGGQAMSEYLAYVESRRDLVRLLGSRAVMIGNDKDHLTTSISYRLNLRGPAVTVQTTCSTSLVAVHLACQSLLNGECDMALAGGVSLRVPQRVGYFRQEGISSRDGHCRAFDARADGSVPSGGVGVVLLKPLAAALEDGDVVRAVIKGSALNNDGSNKVGYTAPSVEGQAAVIAEALAVAEVHPETISYVETHGTGTPLGDPIEIAALTNAYRRHTDATGYCAIGSVKTNIGHTDAAAGVAGLIKTVLGLEHRAIPPSLHFEEPNPQIDFARSPFFVNASLPDWPSGGTPRRAAVSSFGIGGTNAHAILEEAPERPAGDTSTPSQLVMLSAATRTALDAQVARLGTFLRENPSADLADVAYTLRVGRKALEHRAILVCTDAADGVAGLADPRRRFVGLAPADPRPVTFMFPGGSAQHRNMARELYRWEPAFREEVDRCAVLLEPEIGADVRAVLYRGVGGAEAHGPITAPLEALPALFVTEYALARLWMSWGVRPQAIIGHSLGEYVAACLAGVLNLPDALRLVAVRSRLIQRLVPGAMLSVSLSEEEVRARVGERLSVAGVNGPTITVVSGREEQIAAFEASLAAEGVGAQRLNIAAASHSVEVEPILDDFLAVVSEFQLAPPTIPFVSGTSGTWIRSEEATDPAYWAEHLRRTVRFSDGLGLLFQEPNRLLLEVGPSRTLSSLASRHPSKGEGHVALPSLPHPGEPVSDLAFVYQTFGRLWLEGVDVDRAGFRSFEARRRVPLPTYPFERQRHWIEATAPSRVPDGRTEAATPGPAFVPEPESPPPPLASPEGAASANGPREPAPGAEDRSDGNGLQLIIERQLHVMRRQLELLEELEANG